jgi:hypothetical protein
MGAEDLTGVQPTPPVGEEVKQPAEVQQPAKEGAVEALQAIREEMQGIKGQLQMKDQAIEMLQRALAQKTQQEGLQDEDVPTVKEIKQMITQENEARAAQQRQQDLARYAKDAKVRHPDYDAVIKLAEEVVRDNPELKDNIFRMNDPFEAAYSAGMLHSSYKVQQETKAAKEAANRIAANLNQPKTLTDIGGGGEPTPNVNYKELARTNPKALEDKLHDLMFGR